MSYHFSYASLKSNGIADFNAEVEFHHKFIEASKFAYAARSRLGDMDFIQDALELSHNITSDWWAEEIRFHQEGKRIFNELFVWIDRKLQKMHNRILITVETFIAIFQMTTEPLT